MLANKRFASALLLFAFNYLAGCERPPVKSGKSKMFAENRCGERVPWGQQGKEDSEYNFYNRVQITTTEIRWNGTLVDKATLSNYLDQVKRLEPQPITALIPQPQTNCEKVGAIRRMMETHLRCSISKMCTEYSESEWAKHHPPLRY